ncbi:MAG TPA: sulfur carrier protein ThiS [Planctomycetota bacterium]|nr:sulfur carrier protein ThiS [Planctomycetota bacterium]
MLVTVNDQDVELPDGATVAELLRRLGLEKATVAVEKNREIVPRARHGSERLTAGDRLEIVTLVGGG